MATDYSKQLAELIKTLQSLPSSPDYTEQLKRIADALSESRLPEWATVLISVIIGAVTGVLGYNIQMWLADRRHRDKLRRVLYKDVASLFTNADLIQQNELLRKDAPTEYRKASDLLQDTSEEYLHAHSEAYFELPEHAAATHIYRMRRDAIKDIRDVQNHAGRIQWMIGFYLNKRDLSSEYFHRYVPESGRWIVDTALSRYGKSIEEQKERERKQKKLEGGKDLTDQ